MNLKDNVQAAVNKINHTKFLKDREEAYSVLRKEMTSSLLNALEIQLGDLKPSKTEDRVFYFTVENVNFRMWYGYDQFVGGTYQWHCSAKLLVNEIFRKFTSPKGLLHIIENKTQPNYTNG